MSQQMLVPIEALTQSKYSDDSFFDSMAVSGGYLPRLQLFGSSAEAVKKKKIGMGNFGVVIRKDEIEDLGEEVQILPLSWRPKVMKLKNDGSAPITYYDRQSPEFQAVEATAKADKEAGCSFGPEFLVWVPNIRRFATYFMNSNTAHIQAPELRAQIGHGTTLKSQLIETSKYSWYGPRVFPCVTPFEVPDQATMTQVITKFNNPEDSTEFDVEKLEDNGDSRVR